MRLVPPDNLPHRCAVIPGRAKDPDGWVQTGVVLNGWDQEVEISAAGAREIGRKVGMVPKAEVEEYLEQVRAMDSEIQYLDERCAELETASNAIREIQVKVAG